MASLSTSPPSGDNHRALPHPPSGDSKLMSPDGVWDRAPFKKYSIRGKMAAAAEDQAFADVMNLLEAEPNAGGVGVVESITHGPDIPAMRE